MFALEQSGTAKCLPGQVLLNWLTAAADGHGGISSIVPVGTSGLVDTYRITLADTTTYDFAVTNGRGIKSWVKTGTSGLVDTYTMTLDDGTEIAYTVKNGEKGDKGDNVYTWVKYASQEPTEESHSMGDIPDDWRGEYNGPLAEAPTDWKQYKWYKIKGEQGNTGDPATIVSQSVAYQVSDSGTIIPSGTWETSVPVVGQGKYLWTRSTITYNTGSPVVSYSVSRMGIDGSGSVSSVAGVSPDETGNVALTAADVGALSVSGGDMEGAINMNGQKISGLNDPTEDTEVARKSYVDKMLPKTGGTMSGSIAMGGNKITDLGNPEDDADAATKWYVDKRVPLDGSKQMTGDLQMGGNRITNLGTPTANTDAASVDWVNKNVWAAVYPVGAIYISADSTSPASLFGGTWERLKDRFLLASGDTYAAGATGGEAAHGLTTEELPEITGQIHSGTGVENSGLGTFRDATGCMSVSSARNQGIPTGSTWPSGSTGYAYVNMAFGGNAAHNNMPPYLAVYMWQRVA